MQHVHQHTALRLPLSPSITNPMPNFSHGTNTALTTSSQEPNQTHPSNKTNTACNTPNFQPQNQHKFNHPTLSSRSHHHHSNLHENSFNSTPETSPKHANTALYTSPNQEKNKQKKKNSLAKTKDVKMTRCQKSRYQRRQKQ